MQWIEYEGKKIFFINLKGLRAEEILKVQDEAAGLPGASSTKVLILLNSEGAIMDAKTMQRSRESGRDVIERRTERFAIVGVAGLLQVFLQTHNRVTGAGDKQRLFKNEAEAMEESSYRPLQTAEKSRRRQLRLEVDSWCGD